MFKSDESKKILKQDIETIIGPTVKLDGDFIGQGDIIVEGIVNGNIKTKKYLRIDENAEINAEIEAGDAYISGVVNGNIKVIGKLEITGTAKVKGDIETSIISVESGALINGKLEMKGANESIGHSKGKNDDLRATELE